MYNVCIMTFGYQQGGSFSQHKQALGFDAAAGEQVRMKQILEQRKREIQMRARQELQSKKVKLRIVQDEISRREIDIKRLGGSVARMCVTHHHAENFDFKIRELRNKIKDLEKEIEKETSAKTYAEKTANNQTKELGVVESKKKMEEGEITKLKTDEQKLENDVRELERLAA